MVPTTRLIYLILLGSPLWLLALAIPFGWLAGMAYFGWLAVSCLDQWVALPRGNGLAARREVPQRIAMGDQTTIGLELANRTDHPLHVVVRDEVPDALQAEGPEILQADLPANSSIRFDAPVRAVQRGAHPFGRVMVRASHPHGLIRRHIPIDCPDTARIYPRFRGVDDYRLLAMIDQRDEVVRRPRRLRGLGVDFESLRPYLPGEDLRNVDWKASARHGCIISRNMQVEKGQQLAVLLDVGRLMAETIHGQPRLEHAMNAAVMLAYVAQTRGDAFAAACFSNRIESFLPPVRGLSIMPRVLEGLYRVQLRLVESDYWQVTAEAMAMLRRRSLVVMLTDVLDVAGSAGLINNLVRAARRHLVLCVVMTEPRVRGTANQSPMSDEDVWRKVAACDLLRRRRLALEHMRSKGILVLETDPDRLGIHLVQRYLEIRQAGLL